MLHVGAVEVVEIGGFEKVPAVEPVAQEEEEEKEMEEVKVEEEMEEKKRREKRERRREKKKQEEEEKVKTVPVGLSSSFQLLLRGRERRQ